MKLIAPLQYCQPQCVTQLTIITLRVLQYNKKSTYRPLHRLYIMYSYKYSLKII